MSAEKRTASALSTPLGAASRPSSSSHMVRRRVMLLPRGLFAGALVVAMALTPSNALTTESGVKGDIAIQAGSAGYSDEMDRELYELAIEDAARAAAEARDIPVFKDRSTPPLWDGNGTLEVIAELPDAPAKLAVEAKTGRLFFAPQVFSAPDLEHGEGFVNEWVASEKQARPFPSGDFQTEIRRGVAALTVDNLRGWLLVLDASPFEYAGPMTLVILDLATGAVVRRFEVPESDVGQVTPANMVICPRSQFVYIANNGVHSGSPSLVAIDLHVWRAWTMLEDHEATLQRSVLPILNGRDPVEYPWRTGLASLAVDAQGKRLVLGSMYGDHLYAVPLRALRGAESEEELRAHVELLGPKTTSDAIDMDPATGNLYVTDFEHSALTLIEPANGWAVMTLVRNEALLRWPSDIVIANGHAYVACSALDKIMDGNHRSRASPFQIVRFMVYKEDASHHQVEEEEEREEKPAASRYRDEL